MSNLALVCIDAHALTYVRFINRCRHVKVKAETPLTREEVEGFRQTPTLYVEGLLPDESVSA